MGAQYVVTLDADGQNDPAEIPVMLQPLVDDEADFVVASRVLGRDTTTDRFRKAGVRVFSWTMSVMGHTKLTDTSNGYRALRVSMLDDVALPAHPAAVPNGGAPHHRHEARLAGHRTAHGLVAPCVGHDQEGQELALRLPLRARRARHVVEVPGRAATHVLDLRRVRPVAVTGAPRLATFRGPARLHRRQAFG